MKQLTRLLLVVSAISLAACGFQPLYQTGEAQQQLLGKLSAVEVAPIPDRLGQITRNELNRLLDSSGSGPLLNISLSQSTEGFGIRKDAAATQEQLTLTAKYTLMSGDDLLLEGVETARVSYDLVLSDFATIVQQEDSARRLALELASRIHRKLALYYRAR